MELFSAAKLLKIGQIHKQKPRRLPGEADGRAMVAPFITPARGY